MSKMQRTKGAAGERDWVAMLRAAGFTVEGRVLGQARDGGGDVVVAPVLYEVKRYAKFAVYEHMQQAEVSAARQGLMPAVALRGDGKEWLVVMKATDLLPLLKGAPAFNHSGKDET